MTRHCEGQLDILDALAEANRLGVGSLFSGYGGLDMALQSVLPDTQPAWFVENGPAASKVLNWHWPDVPNLGDVTRVDWSTVESVDVLMS